MTGKMMEGKEWREEEGQSFQGRSKVRMHWDGWRRSKWDQKCCIQSTRQIHAETRTRQGGNFEEVECYCKGHIILIC